MCMKRKLSTYQQSNKPLNQYNLNTFACLIILTYIKS